MVQENTQYTRLVPGRVCGWCGKPLCREHVEPGQQSVGVCSWCAEDEPQVVRFRERHDRYEYDRAGWASMICFWCGAGLFCIVIWWLAFKSLGIL